MYVVGNILSKCKPFKRALEANMVKERKLLGA
jgi:hypothetical protein